MRGNLKGDGAALQFLKQRFELLPLAFDKILAGPIVPSDGRSNYFQACIRMVNNGNFWVGLIESNYFRGHLEAKKKKDSFGMTEADADAAFSVFLQPEPHFVQHSWFTGDTEAIQTLFFRIACLGSGPVSRWRLSQTTEGARMLGLQIGWWFELRGRRMVVGQGGQRTSAA